VATTPLLKRCWAREHDAVPQCLIDAEGIELDGNGKANGRGGRSASYRLTVQSNGNLLIGSAYTKQLDLKPGDEFEISLSQAHPS